MTRLPRALVCSLAAVLLTASSALADLVPLNLRYPRLSLANGRVLKDATLRSFNREAGLIYVLEDHQLKPYPVALFPGFVTDRIDARAAEHPEPSAKSVPPASPAAPTNASAPQSQSQPPDYAAREEALRAAVATKAREAALRHLRYKLKLGSGYTTVTDVDLDLRAPEPVRGWSQRYRVEGDSFYSYYESVGGAFHRRSRGIEILLEAKSPTDIKVLEINTRWGSSWN
ncbi:hypothetical protein [Actomonas aquatica]|uniref:Uncharacterized protein n=1 Tax=Actomonas aquatica TaxID=2866162 RepID=A0ABZ1C515_9BACT|nr:hypothetical protein [Opitutus sp. WL0086]WRQ86437.1 hypothetical protein K1X11_016600 [Opitutus sp. WL0086]